MLNRVGLLALFLFVGIARLTAQDVAAELSRPLMSGSVNARVKLEVFIDLQCSACANFNMILRDVEAKHPSDVATVFRQFPLRIPAHDKAIMAARMIEAARLQGKGREMMDLLFANQKRWANNANARLLILGYARKLKLNMPRFTRDLEDDITMRPIIDDVVKAEKLGIRATPTIFLNGKELGFEKALDLESVVTELLK